MTPPPAQYTAGVAWHCYAGDPSAQTTVHNAFPGKDTYFTECSGTQSSNPANTFADSPGLADREPDHRRHPELG